MFEVKLVTTNGTRYIQCDSEHEAVARATWTPSILGALCVTAEVVRNRKAA